MSKERGPDDYDMIESLEALGWGGMIVRDGVASPMPDELALELALPQWADEVHDTDVVVDLCLRALSHDSVSLRVVALEALARVMARPEPLPRLAEVRREIQRAFKRDDPRLQSAAQAALAAIARHERSA
jgi:C4-dicarboxylate-specific signal transduction histidine kinase